MLQNKCIGNPNCKMLKITYNHYYVLMQGKKITPYKLEHKFHLMVFIVLPIFDKQNIFDGYIIITSLNPIKSL